MRWLIRNGVLIALAGSIWAFAAPAEAETALPAPPPHVAKPALVPLWVGRVDTSPRLLQRPATSGQHLQQVQTVPPSWPKTVPEAQAEAQAKQGASPLPSSWPAQDIEFAKARCTELLKEIEAVAIPEPPVREGECGAPAPVRLISVGRNPEVALSPPALLTCDMAVALHKWLKTDLQPLARKHLGAPVIKIETMSDYSCRNAYGRVKTRLSEHGRANALDIRGFITASGETAIVLDDWGLTAREVQAIAAAEKAASQKAAAQAAAGGRVPASPQSLQVKAASAARSNPPPAGLVRSSLIEGVPQFNAAVPGATASPKDTEFGLAPAKLGGPKPADATGSPVAVWTPIDAAEAQSKKAQFLRQAHAGACRTFGTALGPEANNAHRNHLHVDMAERANGAFCE